MKAWAEKEEALTGFYHGILSDIKERVQVENLIDIGNVYVKIDTGGGDYMPGGTKTEIGQIGDRIGTVVKDSLVQRSTIGGDTEPVKKCPNCGKDVSEAEKFCLECGEQLK